MSEQFLSEIRIFSFAFAPKGWAMCNGQTLPINQNQALFALIGTFYGGNGTTNFLLPNLQGKVALSVGPTHSQGQVGGESTHTLNQSEMPQHTHQAVGGSAAGNQINPTNAFWAADNADAQLYNATANNAAMSSGAIRASGGQPHNNMAPYLTLNFCIALVGIFPSRN